MSRNPYIIIAVLVVAAIAVAGIGYAITFTATTTSDTNDIDGEYVKLDITDSGAKITGSEIALNNEKIGTGARSYTLPTNIPASGEVPALQMFAKMPFSVTVTHNNAEVESLHIYAAVGTLLDSSTHGLTLYYKLDNGSWTLAEASSQTKTSWADLGTITITDKEGNGTIYLAVTGTTLTQAQVESLGDYTTTVSIYTYVTDDDDYRPALPTNNP